MRLISTILLVLMISGSLRSQQFLWAKSYDISDCNEVAALSIDTLGNIYICGVHDAPPTLPYTGEAYIQKSDPQGLELWYEEIEGSLRLGDMATIGNKTLIAGQAYGFYHYKGEQYGLEGAYFFLLMLDANGDPEWHIEDDTKFGTYSSIAKGKFEVYAIHTRGQGNLLDWILIMDVDGNILDSRLISPNVTSIVDIAYSGGRVFVNGDFNGPGSLIIDTIVINQPLFESATFVLGFDENLVASWVAIDSTFNNFDGRIECSTNSVFVYESVIDPPFSIHNVIKKFNFEGQLQSEVEPPFFSNAIALYPDMAVSSELVGIFAQNDFSFDSHKIIFYDHNLNIVSEKYVDGLSDLYSGQISEYNDDFYVAHVHSGELNFNNELVLLYSGFGKKPYIACLGDPLISKLPKIKPPNQHVKVFPNPASDFVFIQNGSSEIGIEKLVLYNNYGKQLIAYNAGTGYIDISKHEQGIYFVLIYLSDGSNHIRKVVIN